MRKFFTMLILFGLFLPLTLSAMIMTSMRPWILDRSFYEGIVNDDRVYDALLNGELANQLNRQIFAADQLPVAALNSAVREVITPNYLRTQAAYVVNEMVDFIRGRASKFDISIDLVPLKTALTGADAQRFADTLAAALPFCDSDQTSVAPAGTLPRCISNKLSIAATAAQIVHALPAALQNTPDRMLLSDPFDLQTDLPALDRFLEITVRSGLDMAIVMVILLAVLVGILLSYMRGSDLYENLRWLGKSLLVPAACFMLIGLILAHTGVTNPLHSALGTTPLAQAVANITVMIIKRAGSGLLMTGALTAVITFVLFMVSSRTNTTERAVVKMVQVQNN